MIYFRNKMLPIKEREDAITRARKALRKRKAELSFAEYPVELRKKLKEMCFDPENQYGETRIEHR